MKSKTDEEKASQYTQMALDAIALGDYDLANAYEELARIYKIKAANTRQAAHLKRRGKK